jgi:hypothetical protein
MRVPSHSGRAYGDTVVVVVGAVVVVSSGMLVAGASEITGTTGWEGTSETAVGSVTQATKRATIDNEVRVLTFETLITAQIHSNGAQLRRHRHRCRA